MDKDETEKYHHTFLLLFNASTYIYFFSFDSLPTKLLARNSTRTGVVAQQELRQLHNFWDR